MMNKYILMLGVAAVSIGSYCAYAGNSATMTVTATIAHDVSLSVTQDINLGTITINPAYDEWDTEWQYNESGVFSYHNKRAIVSADNATVGIFTANISNPQDCNTHSDSCGGLSVTGNSGNEIYYLFGNGSHPIDNLCGFQIKYSGSGNNFTVFPDQCYIEDISQVTPGRHNGTLTISYTAQ